MFAGCEDTSIELYIGHVVTLLLMIANICVLLIVECSHRLIQKLLLPCEMKGTDEWETRKGQNSTAVISKEQQNLQR
jgi:hypothetical protein